MKTKILVVSHDAGGANILRSLIKKYHDNFKWITCTLGPARDIFSKKESNLQSQKVCLRNNDINGVLKSVRPDYLLTGTSWASNLEIDFIRYAKIKNIKTAAFLDHWCNYRERFGYPCNWKKNLPDIVFTGDKWAYDMALKAGFPAKKIRLVENPYMKEVIKEAKLLYRYAKRRVSKNNKIRILYLSEPVHEHALKIHGNPTYWGYTEYGIIKDLINVKKVCEDFSIELKIRLHPAENKDKYKKTHIPISVNKQLVKDCLWADIVVGGDTMALVIAALIGKKAVSYIPSVKKRCSLPHKEIIKIHSFGGLIKEIKSFKKNGKIKKFQKGTSFIKVFHVE